MAARVVRFPQVRHGMASEGVGRRLARTGVVGTWLGTGFRTSLPSCDGQASVYPRPTSRGDGLDRASGHSAHIRLQLGPVFVRVYVYGGLPPPGGADDVTWLRVDPARVSLEGHPATRIAQARWRRICEANPRAPALSSASTMADGVMGGRRLPAAMRVIVARTSCGNSSKREQR
jgi:hypothetical protein